MKTIQDAVKNGARLSYEDRWLHYDNGSWVVYMRSYGQRKTREICRVDKSQEQIAVRTLLNA